MSPRTLTGPLLVLALTACSSSEDAPVTPTSVGDVASRADEDVVQAEDDVVTAPDTVTSDDIDEPTDGSIQDTDTSQPLPLWAQDLAPNTDYVGIAVVDITPPLLEPFEDLNGNKTFDGCLDDPTASGDLCDEPFTDTNGNGRYDGAFIAGFGGARAATGVHDPITARAVAFARGQSDGPPKVAVLVSLDVVGLGNDHIMKATEILVAEDGLETDQVVVSSTHTHQGPDVRGMWGKSPEWSGANPEYNALVRAGIVDAARAALAALAPASLRVGQVAMRERSPWFNGERFGGSHPQPHVHGLLRDIRDPVVVDDRVTLLSAARPDGAPIGSVVFFSGHPELLGDKNTLLSSDYVHFTREALETALGGDCVFVSTALGGMMSGLGADVPLVADDGSWVVPDGAAPETVGLDGTSPPEWAPKKTFDHARSFGIHVAEAALFALQSDAHAESTTLDPFVVQSATFAVPPDNGELLLLYKLGLFDIDPSYQLTDAESCPELNSNTKDIGCLAERVWHWRLGSLETVTAPGELLPELFYGLPTDDPTWTLESEDASLRGADRGSKYWRSHPPTCDLASWTDCQFEKSVDVETPEGEVECECVDMHRVPYIALPEALPPGSSNPVDLLSARFRVLVGNGGDHLGYIIQASDFHRNVSQIAGGNGDHYEETVSVSYRMAERWDAALRSLLGPN